MSFYHLLFLTTGLILIFVDSVPLFEKGQSVVYLFFLFCQGCFGGGVHFHLGWQIQSEDTATSTQARDGLFPLSNFQ